MIGKVTWHYHAKGLLQSEIEKDRTSQNPNQSQNSFYVEILIVMINTGDA